MSFAQIEPDPMEDETLATDDAAEPSSKADLVESPAALHLRFILIQDQLNAAASKVNMLHKLGLERTAGYAEAFALYEAKLADYNGMRARFGV